ncbi:alpha/beta hydrolase [Pollutibacter soli]|uniref:alpha/beta hydrolase n=1 Tax=Pollutibacter soli TaxID=3034157 RepID=UPI003013EA4B
MNFPYKIADELVPVLEQFNSRPRPAPGTPLQDVFRAQMLASAQRNKIQSDSVVRVRDEYVIDTNGQEIQLRVYSPEVSAGARPCLYWMHGGGTISGLPEQNDPAMHDIVQSVNCVVISVNYRLAPEHPYPVPLNDCFEGLKYIANNAEKFSIDPKRIAVGGSSAGGLLATSCAMMARNMGKPNIVHQSLAYPMLDNRNETDSSKQILNIGVWDRDMNIFAWQAYLRDVTGDIPDLAVPALAKDLSGLAPAFLAVGTMDVMRDETIEYAQKLVAAGVRTELHLYPGMVHVFDSLVPHSEASIDFISARIDALKRAFSKNAI